jgi:hypothetical protein
MAQQTCFEEGDGSLTQFSTAGVFNLSSAPLPQT